MMNVPTLLVCKSSDVLAANAADLVAQYATEATQQRGRFTLVLSGGTTPEQTYRLLAESNRSTAIAWPKTHIFFADERFVPLGDEHSNYGMVRRTMLARVPIPSRQVFRVPTQVRTAAEAAVTYGAELARFFSPDAHQGVLPRFDLILLGLGEDGHTASLFPGRPALGVKDAWVTWSPPGKLPPPVDRITLTYPVLNAARHVAFLVSGAKKAKVLCEVLEGNATRDDCPAAGVRPTDGTLSWLVDEEAAQQLTQRSVLVDDDGRIEVRRRPPS